MEWTKIPTNLLTHGYSDIEILSIVKYQLLHAMLEKEPNAREIRLYLTRKQSEIVSEYIADITENVSADISSVSKAKNRQRRYYTKHKALRQNQEQNSDVKLDVTDIRIKNKNKNKEEEKEEIAKKETAIFTNQQIEQAFDEFYSCYPRKTGKAKAKERFAIAIKSSKDASIIQSIQYGVKCYSDEIIANKTEQQFIKHPATWLNQKCWIDYIDNKVNRFSGEDEYRLLYLEECILKTVPLTDSEKKEVEEEIATLKRKKEQCQCAILQ